MRKMIIGTALLALAAGSLGCSGAVRDANFYRDDVRKVLDTKAAELKACYDGVLTSNGGAQGSVLVKFDVKEETGKFTNVKIDPAGSNAPQELQDCVTAAFAGLVLKPGDVNPGKATFTYEFSIGGTKPAPPPPAG